MDVRPLPDWEEREPPELISCGDAAIGDDLVWQFPSITTWVGDYRSGTPALAELFALKAMLTPEGKAHDLKASFAASRMTSQISETAQLRTPCVVISVHQIPDRDRRWRRPLAPPNLASLIAREHRHDLVAARQLVARQVQPQMRVQFLQRRRGVAKSPSTVSIGLAPR